MLNPRKLVLATVYAGAIAWAGTALTERTVEAGVCCSQGSQCAGAQLCCDPEDIGALPCQPNAEGYCRDGCGKEDG